MRVAALVLALPVVSTAFSVSSTNPPVVGTNHIFEFLKWGGSTPDFDVLEKTKAYSSLFESTGVAPDESWYHKDYVLRGPVIGPITLKDLRAGQAGFKYDVAFPDLRIESFGYTIDPENPYRCFYFQRWRATHTGTLMAGSQAFDATFNSMETPVSVFSVVWTPDRNIIYEQVGAVVDRFEGNTDGKAAVFGLFHTAGINLPAQAGSLTLRLLQRFGHALGGSGRSFSKDEDIPAWWTSKSRGADPNEP